MDSRSQVPIEGKALNDPVFADSLVKNKESPGFGWVFLTALQSLGKIKWWPKGFTFPAQHV